MAQKSQTRNFAPAEIIAQLNGGLNLYTDPTLTKPQMWADALNVFSGMYGYIERARWASVISGSTSGYSPSGQIFSSLKYFAIPGLSSYLLGDNNGKLWSFDSGNSYAAKQRINPYVDPLGAGTSQLGGPWMRETLENIAYEMNGIVKQSGRLANAATIEGWGLDSPDDSPQVVISAGASVSISSLVRSNGIVTAVLASTLSVPGGNGIGMVNVSGVSDTSFNATFIVSSGSGTTTLTWLQPGQNTTLGAGGTVDVNITKTVGRSYAWAWENANKPHVGAPSPSTQFILYSAQNGEVELTEVGSLAASSGTVVSGTGTLFTSAWVGRSLWVQGTGNAGRIISVQSQTQLTLAASATIAVNSLFQVFDPQSTHVRLYQTADGGATYFRVQRNTFVPTATTLVASGLAFFDNANAEPPNFPFTTETSQLYNIPPPVGSFIKEYQGTLIIYGIPGLPQTFFYTNQSLTSVGLQQESSAPLNQVTLPIQNAAINGMAEFPGALVIWSDKQDMFRMTGLLSDNTSATGGQQGGQISALPYNLGCASPFAVALTPLGAIWLTPNAEVWLFTDSYAPRQIGHPIQAILQTVLPQNLKLARAVYYHTFNRNWFALAVAANGAAQNNTLLLLDIDLLASNGSPSFFVFDMATNNAVWYKYALSCAALETMYETNGIVRLFAGGVDAVEDADFRTGFGAEIAVPNGTVTLHAWGNDHPFVISRPSFIRFNTNQDPSLLASQGWQFQALGIDDDFYTFDVPLALALTPGQNDSTALSGNPNLATGEAFRHSPDMFRIGGVNFVAGRRIKFSISFPSAAGTEFRLRSVQLGFGPEPPS